MSSLPLVSIVIPCYNVQEFLRDALDSALAQTWPAVEVIAVDDASADSTPDILREYEQRFPRLRVIRHAANQKLCQTRNAGYAHARGEYVLWLDADDYIASDFVATLMREAMNTPGAAVAGPWRKVRLSGGKWSPDPDIMVNTSAGEVLRAMIRGGWPLHCMACLFPRRAMEEVGGWDESMTMHEDRLLLSLLLLQRFPFVFVQESCAFYRLRSGSLATMRSESVARSALHLAQVLEQKLQSDTRHHDLANDFAHFLDLYYIDCLPGLPLVAAEFLSMRNRVCPQYRDLRAPHSRLVRAVLGDRLFARLAKALKIDRKR